MKMHYDDLFISSYGCRRTSKKLLNAPKLALPAGSFLEVSALGNLHCGVTSGGHGSLPGDMGVTRTIAATARKILTITSAGRTT